MFQGQVYRHRVSTTGDTIAGYLYEDLLKLGQSLKLVERTENAEVAVNTGNQIKGKKGRRGDGTFGRVGRAVRWSRRTRFLSIAV